MGQLAGDSGERGDGIDDDPADRLVDVRGMPAHRHGRMAGVAGIAWSSNLRPVSLTVSPSAGSDWNRVCAKRLLRPRIQAAASGGSSSASMSASSTIVMSCVGLRQRSTISRYAARVASSAAAGRMARSFRSPSTWPIDGAVSRASSRRNRSNCGSTSSSCGWEAVSNLNGVASPVTLSTWVWSPSAVVRASGACNANFSPAWTWRSTPVTSKPPLDGLLDLDRVKAQVGRAGAFHPLFEEPLEVPGRKPVPVARGCRRSRPCCRGARGRSAPAPS